ncbi:hypothetical protein, partial [Streptosporangium saharense]|uniref:hypothetical protein n=1 Tax=Streptosporangium saharense TaxID=1706840 RepID=UPI00335719E5
EVRTVHEDQLALDLGLPEETWSTPGRTERQRLEEPEREVRTVHEDQLALDLGLPEEAWRTPGRTERLADAVEQQAEISEPIAEQAALDLYGEGQAEAPATQEAILRARAARRIAAARHQEADPVEERLRRSQADRAAAERDARAEAERMRTERDTLERREASRAEQTRQAEQTQTRQAEAGHDLSL